MKNRKSIHALGETEMEVLGHVWELGEATVAQVHERISAQRKTAYTTIMTVMKNLAEKEYLQYRAEGPGYVYSAQKPAVDVKRSLLNGFIGKVFGGSPVEMVQTLVRNDALTADELEALRALLEDRK
jgi:predicted transcriptional regulator